MKYFQIRSYIIKCSFRSVIKKKKKKLFNLLKVHCYFKISIKVTTKITNIFFLKICLKYFIF